MKSNHKDSQFEITQNAMNRNIVRLVVMAVFALNGARLLGQQQASLLTSSSPGPASANATHLTGSEDNGGTQASDALATAATNAPAESDGAGPKGAPATDGPHKLGPFNVT